MSFHENPNSERELIRATEEEIERTAEQHADGIDLNRDRDALPRLIDRVRDALRRHDSG
jgi:hypothetical protein